MSALEPKYIQIARRYLGLREIKGPQHNSVIVGWLRRLRAWWADDETPWCGVAMAAWMSEAGLPYPKAYYRAMAWKEYGIPCAVPALGAIAVLTRPGGGHVGIVTGVSRDRTKIRMIGGNQGDMVSESWFDAGRVAAYRLPPGGVAFPAPIASVGAMSSSEA